MADEAVLGAIDQPEIETDDEAFFAPEEDILFEGGPSRAMVELWQKQFGQIFMTEIANDNVYVWRVLSRRELKELAKLDTADALEREDVICQKCVIWPADFDAENALAGTATVLSEQIFEKSGFRPLTNPIPL